MRSCPKQSIHSTTYGQSSPAAEPAPRQRRELQVEAPSGKPSELESAMSLYRITARVCWCSSWAGGWGQRALRQAGKALRRM